MGRIKKREELKFSLDDIDLEDRFLIAENKSGIFLEFSKIESDIDAKCDYLLHLADMATRQVTSARIKYDLDHPKQNYPFLFELFIYLVVSALPLSAVFSATYLTFKGFFSKSIRELRGNKRFLLTDSVLKEKIKKLDEISSGIKKLKIKNPKLNQERNNLLVDIKAKNGDLSIISAMSDFIGSAGSGFAGTKLKGAIKDKSKSVEGLYSKDNSIDNIIEMFKIHKDKVVLEATGIPQDGVGFEPDVAFFKEMKGMVQMYKRSLKMEIQAEKKFMNELQAPLAHFQNYFNFLQYFNSFANSEQLFPLKDPEYPSLPFESASIARMELIIWARLYNWKNRVQILKPVKPTPLPVSTMYDGDARILESKKPETVESPSPILPEKYHDYFKERFIDSPYSQILGTKFKDSQRKIKSDKSASQGTIYRKEQKAFVKYMAALRKDLLKANEDMKSLLN